MTLSVTLPTCLSDIRYIYSCSLDFKPIPPCRSLCEAVRDGCTPDMARFNFPWPKMLECSQFPEDNNLCIRLQSEGTITESPTLPSKYSSSYIMLLFKRHNLITGLEVAIV